MILKKIRLIGFCLLFTGCAFLSKSPQQDVTTSVYPEPDPGMVEKLDAYRDLLKDTVGQKIATVADTIRFNKPEGALNNLVADGLRFRASSELRTFVNVGIISDDMFKLFLVPGELTLGDVYEFMPYNNHLVVLSMRGERLLKLIKQVAEVGGAPISGVRFRIDKNGQPNSILVNSEVLDPAREYLVATDSWDSNGNGRFSALWDIDNRIDLDVPLQEVYAEYFRNQVVLTASTDGRIRR